jgi:hypothetical protein
VVFPFFSRSSTRTTPRMHSLMKATPPSHYPRFRIHTLPIDLQVFCVVLPPRSTTPPCHPSTHSTTLPCRCSTPMPFALPCWGAGVMQSHCLSCQWIARTPLMRCTVRADADKFQSDKWNMKAPVWCSLCCFIACMETTMRTQWSCSIPVVSCAGYFFLSGWTEWENEDDLGNFRAAKRRK